MASTKYIKASAIKKLAKEKGKRVSAEFLLSLDEYINHKIATACDEHNGGKKTLDIGLAAYFFGHTVTKK
jgi:hypothetical protein